MKKMQFSTTIEAPKEVVWNSLWDDNNYRQWTSAFCEGSYAVTDGWKEGTEVKFLDPSGNGMLSRVAENRPNEFMSFEFLGEVRDGQEDRTSERVQAWAGGREDYMLVETNGKTELRVEQDMADEYAAMFSAIWPKALQNVKALAEGKSMPAG